MRTADRERRVVVTGVGMVSPLANGVRLSWERLIAGRSGIARIQAFDPSDLPVKIAGEIPNGDGEGEGAFRPADIVPTKDLRKMDDFIVYALCAAVEAVEDFRLEARGRGKPGADRRDDRLRDRRAQDHRGGDRPRRREGAPAAQPVLHPVEPDQPGLRPRLHPLRLSRTPITRW